MNDFPYCRVITKQQSSYRATSSLISLHGTLSVGRVPHFLLLVDRCCIHIVRTCYVSRWRNHNFCFQLNFTMQQIQQLQQPQQQQQKGVLFIVLFAYVSMLLSLV